MTYRDASPVIRENCDHSEGIFESYDPFAFKVNNVSVCVEGLVRAFKPTVKGKVEEIINDGSRLTDRISRLTFI